MVLLNKEYKMEELWNQWSLFEQVMICVALVSTLVFIIQASMAFLGIELGDIDDLSSEGNAFLQIISLRNIVIFMACFSWTNFLIKNNGLNSGIALTSGVIIGSVAIILNLLLLKFISSLSENGRFDISDITGAEGTVYTPVSSEKPGIIQVHYGGGIHELKAISKQELKSHTPVRVIRILSNDIVEVDKI